LAAALWLALNKPAEVLTTRRDPAGRRTVYDFIPPGLPRVEAVGRLDRATTGLLLFTDDFTTSQALLDPEYEIPRTYQVVTDAPLPATALAILAQGAVLADGTLCAPVAVKPLAAPAVGRSYLFTLREGKNREVRRLVEQFGRRVRGLHRRSFGPVDLGDLGSGRTRSLTPVEIDRIHRWVQRGR
jgi:23S rRNA pseudouridine2605 synthase